jgi:hypothetical protein
MHPPEVKARALELVAQGLNHCEISRRMGIPPRNDPRLAAADLRPAQPRDPQRDMPPLLARRKADALHAWRLRGASRDLPRRRLPLGAPPHPATSGRAEKYPRIISDVRCLLERCIPHNRVDEVRSIACVHVSVYSTHPSCVLPQHGLGRKHERRILLEPWQHGLVDVAPWPFIRGCFRTDGCVFVNRTRPYEDLSYDFANKSDDMSSYSWAHAGSSASATGPRDGMGAGTSASTVGKASR